MKELLAQLVRNTPLTFDQAVTAFDQIMSGSATPPQIGAMLALIQQRGPSVDEIAGAASVMRSKATAVKVPKGLRAIDTCGTGGDHASTFNISTAAAIVTAAAARPKGVVVAKHGNRSVTSNSGSSQVLEVLGVQLQVTGETLTRCLDEAGICFCFAPMHHPAMKHAVPVRQELGFRTIFNLLGPLTNPAGARRQIIGVYDPALTQPLASVLAQLGSEHAMVVCGNCGDAGNLDELSTCGPSQITHLQLDGEMTTEQFDAASLGLKRVKPSVLQVDGPQESADTIRAVLSNDAHAACDIVCLNAAAALVVADVADDMQRGLAMAQQAVESGAAHDTLEKLVTITREN